MVINLDLFKAAGILPQSAYKPNVLNMEKCVFMLKEYYYFCDMNNISFSYEDSSYLLLQEILMITFGFALNRDATILELREGLMHILTLSICARERERERECVRERVRE